MNRVYKLFKGLLGLVILIGVFCVAPKITLAGTYGFSPSTNNIFLGDTFSVQIFVNTSGDSVNALSGSVNYPTSILEPVSISTSESINFWIKQPSFKNGNISFEGIALDPGFSGNRVSVLTATFRAKKIGISEIKFTEGAILKNDGLGTNVISGLSTLQIKVSGEQQKPLIETEVETTEQSNEEIFPGGDLFSLPVITDYSSVVSKGDRLFVKGVGEPNALTLIQFQLLSKKTLGEKMLNIFGRRRQLLSDVYIINNPDGSFEYTSNQDVVPGVYTAVPFFVGQGTSNKEPGLGAQLSILGGSREGLFANAINLSIVLIPVLLIGLIATIIYRRKKDNY